MYSADCFGASGVRSVDCPESCTSGDVDVEKNCQSSAWPGTQVSTHHGPGHDCQWPIYVRDALIDTRTLCRRRSKEGVLYDSETDESRHANRTKILKIIRHSSISSWVLTAPLFRKVYSVMSGLLLWIHPSCEGCRISAVVLVNSQLTVYRAGLSLVSITSPPSKHIFASVIFGR